MKFEKGDRVVKARPFEPHKYCKWGGSSQDVSIGTKGTITSLDRKKEDANVSFDNGVNWNVSQSELDHNKSTLMDLEYKETPKAPEIDYSGEEDEEEPDDEPEWHDED